MTQTLLYSHASFGGHEVPPGHVEHPGRFAAVEKALAAEEFSDVERRLAPAASGDAIDRVHGSAFRDAVEKTAPAEGLAQLDADTFMGPTSLDACLRAAGGAIAAVDAVAAGEAKNAFVAARPPGHHAEPQRAMGFCVFNSVAVAAHHARAEHGWSRIAVVDFDVHLGNGTEAAFWHDENAFFASSHEWPQYPGTGRESDRGAFDNIVNAPLATGTGGEAFRRVWGERLLPALSDFAPDIVFISAGFDAHGADPLGGLRLTEDDFSWITREIAGVAADKCDGRLVSLMEGGYDLGALAASAAAHVTALMAAPKRAHKRAGIG
ncbi:MAG: histone deacetylase family protein [Pseudomonadota bacterium]